MGFFQFLLKARKQSCCGVLSTAPPRKRYNKSPFLFKLDSVGFCDSQSRGTNTAGISLTPLQEYKVGARQTNLLNEGKLAPDPGFLISAKGTSVFYKYSHIKCETQPQAT